jgi:hypothetical protein
MRCGNWLSSLFGRQGAKLALNVPYELGASEVVARVLYSKNQFSVSRMRPKPSAFNPSPYTELSGVHVTGLPEAVIWEIAKNTAGREPGRTTIYARADVLVGQFISQKLRAVRDDNPFARHTSVMGWPKMTDLDAQKERWKEICLALSESLDVNLVLPVTPIRTDES